MARNHKISGKPFAAFDIDGTLFRSSLVIKFVLSAIDVGLFPPETADMFEDSYRQWKERSSEDAYDQYISDVVEAFLVNIDGKTEAEMGAAVQKTMDWHRQTYVYTRELIKKLQKTHVLIAISGSNTEILRHFAPRYGFDIFYGTELIKKNGRFVGKEARIGHHRKDQTLKNIIADNNLKYEGSVAVGDTDSDVAMLEVAEQPIAFNPSRRLFEHAKAKNWKIVIERKNMVYELEAKNGRYQLV